MGYGFLLLSLLAGVTKGYCGKRTSSYVNEYKDAMLANSIRMLFCIIIGLGMILFSGGVKLLAVNKTVLWITLLSGIGNSALVVLWLVSVKRGAYMMLDVFCTIGVLIPIFGCSMLFGESILPHHIVGILILFAAVFIMCSYNNSIKTKITLSSFILMILCGISNGISDFSQKLFVNFAADTPISVFNLYTYLFSAILLFSCFFVFSKNSGEKTNIQKIFPYILVMSVCLFLNSYFKTLAAKYLSSAELYPLAQGGSLAASSIMSAIFFRERITLKCVIGLALTLAALIVINVLKF